MKTVVVIITLKEDLARDALESPRLVDVVSDYLLDSRFPDSLQKELQKSIPGISTIANIHVRVTE